MEYGAIVIGGGSGGARAARRVAELGIKTAIIEEKQLGGTCVNRGCVPKKLLVKASSYHAEQEVFASYGWESTTTARHNWRQMQTSISNYIKKLNGIYENLLNSNDVDIYKGSASFKDKHTLQISDGRIITGERIIIAVGGKSFVPSIEGIGLALSSDDIFALEECPGSIIIQGSGYIAMEFAHIFNGLGSDVKVIYRSPLPLPSFDEDIRHEVASGLVGNGIELLSEKHISSVQRKDGCTELSLTTGESYSCDVLMLATGRVPNTDSLHLSNAGIEVGKKGEIIVDENFTTETDNIFAIGDCLSRVQLTPVAIREAEILVARNFRGEELSIDYSKIPTAVFTRPGVSSVGFSEREALERYPGDITIYKSKFTPLGYSLEESLASKKKTLIKMVVKSSDRKVLGIHMVGDESAEIIQLASVAVGMGASKEDFDKTIAIHPTVAEEMVTLK